ncbi:MAG: hypothetical protein ACOYM1_12235 [Methylovulum sp.]
MNSNIECMNHITLTTGHNLKIRKSEVSTEIIDQIILWLDVAIKSEPSVCLPGLATSDYTADATESEACLIMTIYGHSNKIAKGQPVPLVTLCVVNQEHRENDVWQLMSAPHMPPVACGVVCPEKPYMGVSVWPMSVLFFEALGWLGDLERCIAWAWMEKKKN